LSWQTLISIPQPIRLTLGFFVTLSGALGVYCSAMIYRVPARPSWDTWRTPIAFFSTAFSLGPLLALVIFSWNLFEQTLSYEYVAPTLKVVGTWLALVLLLSGFSQIAGIFVKLMNSFSHEEPELQASARLLTQRFKTLFLSRLGVLLGVLLLTPLVLFNIASDQSVSMVQLASWLTVFVVLLLVSELVGRYLFFVTVVPKKRPEGYF